MRDRATLYLEMLGADGSTTETTEDVKEFLFGDLNVPLANLESSIKKYVSFATIFFLLGGSQICFSI